MATTTTRKDSSGRLEVFHQPTDSYVPAAFIIPQTSGSSVSLSSSDEEIFSNINDLLTYIEILSEDISSSLTIILDTMANAQTGMKKQMLDIVAAINALSTYQTNIIQGLANVQNAIQQNITTASVPKIINLQVPANTETPFTFPAGTKKMTWKCRGDGDTGVVKYAYEAGKFQANLNSGDAGYYVIADGGLEETEDNLKLVNPLNIYFFSTSALWISIKYWI